MGHNKVTFWDRENLTYRLNETNFGTEQDDFLGQEKSTLSLIKMNFGTKLCVFWGQEKLIFGS